MNAKNNNRNAVIFIIIIFLIIFTSLTLGLLFPNALSVGTKKTDNIIDIPQVSAIIYSDDGESHSLDAKFTVELAEGSADINAKNIELTIRQAMSELEYEKATGSGNIEYITNEVTTQLKEIINEEELVGVYITEIQSGPYRFASPVPETDGFENRRNVLKGLFPNIK